ncbi:MAG TPA: PDZ domain-containing protein [Phycisphaerae bacterium]|nr:PDZ domain-containing protein [Phycisphaerae bacterium]
MIVWLLLLAISQIGGAPASGPTTSTASAPGDAVSAIAELVARLADPRFDAREQATRQLLQADFDVIPALVGRYKTETSHERKLRLRQVIEHLYFRKLMQGQVGFLGIQLTPAEQVIDPATQRPVDCVYAQRVLKDHPAAHAGARDGDIIVSFDGKPVSWFFGAAPPAPASRPDGGPFLAPDRASNAAAEKIERFTQHVKRRTPGSQVRVRVLRPAPALKRITVGAAADPTLTLDGATFVSVPAAMAGVSPMNHSGQGGLMVGNVAPGSAAEKVGLKPRDVVTALNGTPLPPEADSRMLADALKPVKPGTPVTIEVGEIREVELEVTIGRRPVSRLNADDLRDAQQHFALWWRDQTGENTLPPPGPTPFFGQPPSADPRPSPEPEVVP